MNTKEPQEAGYDGCARLSHSQRHETRTSAYKENEVQQIADLAWQRDENCHVLMALRVLVFATGYSGTPLAITRVNGASSAYKAHPL